MVVQTALRLPRASVTRRAVALSRRYAASCLHANAHGELSDVCLPHQPVLLTEVLKAFEPVHIKVCPTVCFCVTVVCQPDTLVLS